MRQALKAKIDKAVASRDQDAIDEILRGEPGGVRYLLSLMYRSDAALRETAAAAIARAANHHPKVVKKVVSRLIWAMTDESNTFLPSAPEVLLAIANEKPELIAPFAPDLVRLSVDTSLSDGLCDTLRRIAACCPGMIGQGMTKSLAQKIKHGGKFDCRSRR